MKHKICNILCHSRGNLTSCQVFICPASYHTSAPLCLRQYITPFYITLHLSYVMSYISARAKQAYVMWFLELLSLEDNLREPGLLFYFWCLFVCVCVSYSFSLSLSLSVSLCLCLCVCVNVCVQDLLTVWWRTYYLCNGCVHYYEQTTRHSHYQNSDSESNRPMPVAPGASLELECHRA